jgi:hypothetical protein
MALIAKQLFDLKPNERRRHERLKLTLPGRYMLSDHLEHPCSTIDVSPVGIAVSGQQKGLVGEHVILYINQIGRLEGAIARNADTWFAVKLQLTPAKSEQLTATLAWLVSHHTHGAPDKRLHQRVMPFRRRVTLTTPDGRQFQAALIDLSVRGGAVRVDMAPPIGTLIKIGRTSARVIRHLAMGVAVEFDKPLPTGDFDLYSEL